MEIVGNLVLPKSYKQGEKLPAILIGYPMGAVKEQSSMLYAQKLAEQGFATLAIDLPFWGKSAGQPRNATEPKELVVVKGAIHVDLYDRLDLIPFDKLTAFFKANLK